tara:strand:- start:17 stop:349 length:333 start_codon:yes stop_codon:yes gene_type:complete
METPVGNGWAEHSKLVLKELETLSAGIASLNKEIQEVKKELAQLHVKQDQVKVVLKWKEKIDEVCSPTQLQGHLKELEDLKTFKTKAITSFLIIQFLMAVTVFVLRFFKM